MLVLKKDINSVVEILEIPLDGPQGVGELVRGPLELLPEIKDGEFTPQGRGLGYAAGAAVVAPEGLPQGALQVGVARVERTDVRQSSAYFPEKTKIR